MTWAESADFWDMLYRHRRMPWDLGGPTPVFERLVTTGVISPADMLVLGAGQGHDARMFARHGFRVTAIDFADEAIAAMETHQSAETPVEIVQADFFWLPPEWNGRYDYIVDYTCFCAILPEKRPDYAGLTSRLLRSGGQFITLAFPIGRRGGGPPYTVQPEEMLTLWQQRQFVLRHREMPPDSVPDRRGVEELLILEKVPPPA
jgi:SAM-dependent methyltransferase